MTRLDADSCARDSALTSAVTIDQTRTLYRTAVYARASDAEGDAWWEEVRLEVAAVLGARTLNDAADFIAWWHHDWSCVCDTPRAAVKRLRDAARAFKLPTRT